MTTRPSGSAKPPTGTVTFLFSDIEGSTKLWEHHHEWMERAHKRQEQIMRDAVTRHDGYAYKMIGDAFQVAFATARDALDAAIDAQRALNLEVGKDASNLQPPTSNLQIKVRMGLHTGVTEERGDDYVGPVLNRTARLTSAGHGGQILVSDATESLVRDRLPEGVTLRDMGERRLKDLTRAEKVYQVVTPDLPSDFPPLKTLDTLPNNLPIQLTSFVGREKEIEEIKRLLVPPPQPSPITDKRGGARLLTLTGAGGCGKTRLSLQVAADALEDFANGVWFVELAPLADPALVPQSVANALNVQEQAGRSIQDALLDYLREKTLLLILDNCEHLIDACAKLADELLHACPKIKILASSREALGIAGEVPHRVPSLSLPPKDFRSLPDFGSLTQFEAVRLFVDRAVTIEPTFAVTNQNAPAVAQICHRLDGIPLALELAAARVKVLSVEQISKRLDDRFKLLTGGSRTALPRQQTLRAAIDWSYSLLSEQERVLLRRLSVFAGGWTLEATEFVCAEEQGSERASVQASAGDFSPLHPSTSARLLEDDVLDLTTHLVDKSLVIVEQQGGEARYRMLETIRQYAREKLLDANETERLRDEHLNFFLKMAEQAEQIPLTIQNAVWVPRLEVEHDNFRAALEWACQRDPEVARWLAGLLRDLWFGGDYLSEAHAWYARVLGLGERTKTKGTAIALLGSGRVSYFLNFWDEALQQLQQSVSLWRELGNERLLAESLFWFGNALINQGQNLSACAIYEENESLFRNSADRVVLASALTYWGRALANTRSDYAAAKVLHEESLAIGRGLKDPSALGATFQNLGYMATQQGDYDAARRYHLESLTWRRQSTHRYIEFALRNVADAMCLQGDYEQAQPFYQEALVLNRAIGDQIGVAFINYRLGYAAVAQTKYDEAATLFSESLEILRERSVQQSLAGCLSGFAELRRAQGDAERAVRLLAFVEAFLKFNQRTLRPTDAIEFERSLTAARAQLDEASFNAAWEAGSKMTLEQAIEYAMTNDKSKS